MPQNEISDAPPSMKGADGKQTLFLSHPHRPDHFPHS
eukprot:CAMPEP_0185035104 /NCGR_PEP_ID=MMETSP1103-20130426/25852_1 /TAXON_ID=36769 /ORGANISM="Paraphysomonas bandaiensis, Strain Caron Lab Isolate" /LENGTH=36 /DNA_ID= /DNA_START= /DNA_END= /DNA_ORIENTATION=